MLEYSETFTGENDEKEDTSFSVYFTESSENPGLFQYEIQDGHRDIDGVENILGSNFRRNPEGLCTWSELPKIVRDELDPKLTPEQRFKYKLISQTVYCDGWLWVSQNNPS